jgi:hypothetical protein
MGLKNNLPMGNIALLCGGHHPQYQQYVAVTTVAASTGIVSPSFTASSTVAATNVIIGPSACWEMYLWQWTDGCLHMWSQQTPTSPF